MKKTTHGGRRIPGPGKRLGAPRKHDQTKINLTARVTPDVSRFLRRHGSIGEAIEAYARADPEFPKFQKINQKKNGKPAPG